MIYNWFILVEDPNNNRKVLELLNKNKIKKVLELFIEVLVA